MVVVGITGGIGSGKTTIANYLKSFGIPLYVADKEAKALMNRSKVIKLTNCQKSQKKRIFYEGG